MNLEGILCPQFEGLDPFRWENRHQSRPGNANRMHLRRLDRWISNQWQRETRMQNVFNFFLFRFPSGV